jgi:hypothetical protein
MTCRAAVINVFFLFCSVPLSLNFKTEPYTCAGIVLSNIYFRCVPCAPVWYAVATLFTYSSSLWSELGAIAIIVCVVYSRMTVYYLPVNEWVKDIVCIDWLGI